MVMNLDASFIVPVNDDNQFKKLEKSLEKDFVNYELIPIKGAKSFFDAWNKGLKKATKKYIILTHQDTEYIGIPDLSKYLKDGVGMVGIAGSTVLHGDQPWWFSTERYAGKILSGQVFYKDDKGKPVMNVFGPFGEVVVLDGVCLITTKEILTHFFSDNKLGKALFPQLIEKEYGTWDFYDQILSLEYIKKGYKLLTIPIVLTHASKGGDKRPSFFESMDKFRDEYLTKTWRV